jgi:hypothetical protein
MLPVTNKDLLLAIACAIAVSHVIRLAYNLGAMTGYMHGSIDVSTQFLKVELDDAATQNL